MKALEKKEKFLERLMNNTLEAIAKNENPQPVSLPEYKKMLDFLEERLNELFDSKRKITRNQERLNREKEVIVKKLSWNPNADAKEVKTVLVDINVKNTGKLIVAVSYLVPGASWSPSYDLRIDSGQNKATLTYSALVRQQTGEDWKNVRLTLSTVQPLQVKSLPKLDPLYLDIVSPEKGLIAGVVVSEDGIPLPGVPVRISGIKINERTTITDEQGRYQFTNLPSGSFNVRASLEGFKTHLRRDVRVYSGKISKLDITLGLASIQETIEVSGSVPTVDWKLDGTSVSVSKDLIDSLTETTDVSQDMLSTHFTLKHLDTVNSSRDASQVTAAIVRVPVEKEHIALPLHTQHVFLKVKVKNSSDTPLLAGPINLFFNGNFVNTARLGYKNPNQSFELPLGIDKAIEVERTLLEKESTIKGFFKRKTEIPLGYKITVKNLKRSRVNVVLRDQIPVSKSQKVKVLIEKIDPKPEKQEEERQHGFITWRLVLKPGEKKVITVKYVIRHPKDAILEKWQGE
jgi:hypothetical protein